ncbi:MAG: hypothetical protein K2O43_01580, partial [Muribaculaceae bacterium]|nr:hypothetical protein [Muribaculaceae bacterium]
DKTQLVEIILRKDAVELSLKKDIEETIKAKNKVICFFNEKMSVMDKERLKLEENFKLLSNEYDAFRQESKRKQRWLIIGITFTLITLVISLII